MTTENTIRVNGETEALAEATTLSVLLADKGVDAGAKGVAVALNGRLVQRATWAETPVAAGDVLEIVQAKQGG
ncbi:hypothetical protein GCM10007276_22210 [Agaricicola taiwanensis]|uniref:Sulfur carrier protein ThiS n=1 Tax=Agaricicola taiwanensis TaxID=591372 RepID=A0A8J2YI65_9RHOB|nr:sulfur carrier protein ThiS [Agaricicola taiwanensis]GGE44634.1 hypothetical protein GCM10007276_22210 [Agaricicola taiwanensis]